MRRGGSEVAADGRDEGAGKAATERPKCRTRERGGPPRRGLAAAEQRNT